MARPRVAGTLCATIVAVAAAVALVPGMRSAVSRASPGEGDQRASLTVPAPPEPAFTVATPRPLTDTPTARYARLLRPWAARTAPRSDAPVAARLSRRTPEDTPNIVLVLGQRTVRGRPWVRVALAVLPNGTSGWLPRRALGAYRFVTTRLLVDTNRLRVTLTDRGRVVFTAPAGIGRTAYPTPRGHFYVRNVLTRFASPTYGPLAFGLSARSATLTDWPGGGFVGIHGTDQPGLVPGRISHGCIRLRNEDIRRLAHLMGPGTPVVVS